MPVACHVYDQFEIAAMRGNPVRISTEDTHDDMRLIKIKDLFVQNGIEYLKADDGTVIELEKITFFEVVTPQ